MAFLACFFCISSGGLEGHAFVGVELDENGVPHGGAQRRMAARHQHPVAKLHLEVDALAEEDLLVHARLPGIGARVGLASVSSTSSGRTETITLSDARSISVPRTVRSPISVRTL